MRETLLRTMSGPKLVKLILLTAVFLALSGCSPQANRAETGTPMNLNQSYRPQYHVTPPQKWVNDPNGLVYYAGEYHLFYQYNPDDTVWGPMHWGHAVSTDLVNWTHLPIALYPDEIGMIFSGSAVIDWNNTAGFGREAMVAVFTHDGDGRQMQSLAYSIDRGRTWAKYAHNPVIEPPNNIRNFRDPKVFWYEPDDGPGYWVMVVSAGSMVLFYTSPDLKNWATSGGFGLTFGATCGFWETPDLFELPVDGGPETRWVLAVAIGSCAPAGGSGMQYFVGDFDGRVFASENDPKTTLWADFGADFYAPQTWYGAPDSRRIWVAWMNDWSYAQNVPTATWRGGFTIPRELSLKTTPAGIRLAQQPIRELQSLRGQRLSWQNEVMMPQSDVLAGVAGETLEIVAEFQIDSLADADRFGFRVRTGGAEFTTVGYEVKGRRLFVDRTQSGAVAFHPQFAAAHTAVMEPVNGRIKIHIFVDRASVEVFGNDGLVAITDQIFPAQTSLGVSSFVDGRQVRLLSLDIYTLDTAVFLLSPDPAPENQ